MFVATSNSTVTGSPPDFKSPIKYVPLPSIVPGLSLPKSATILPDADVVGSRFVSSTVTSSSETSGVSSASMQREIVSNALARLSVKSSSTPLVFCSYATDSTLSSKLPTTPSGTLMPSPTKSAGSNTQTSSTGSYVPAVNVVPAGRLPILITSITSDPSVSFTDVVIVRGIVVPSSPAPFDASRFGVSATASTKTLKSSGAESALIETSGSVAVAVAVKPVRSISLSAGGVNVNSVSKLSPAGRTTVHVPATLSYVPIGALKPHDGSIPSTTTVKNSFAPGLVPSSDVI